MEEMLDFPEYDPHGDPIPAKDGTVPKQKKAIPLTLLKPEQTGTVIRVNDFDNSFLSYISKIGVELNKDIYVKEVLEFDRSMFVVVGKKKVNISSTLAANIFVELKK
jgi:DtxR family Mn-dependent transcriptional regulator